MDQAVTISYRRAKAEDQETIRSLVKAAGLDPTALHWSHFVVAIHPEAGIVGIGQVRPYRRCHELGSMVVRKPYQGAGIGGEIIRSLLASEPGTVYLECRHQMAAYYVRFGFREIAWYRAPLPLWLKAGMGNLLGRLLRWTWRVTVMRWDRE